MPSRFEPRALRFETYYLNHWDVHLSGNNHTTTLGYLSNNDLLKSVNQNTACSVRQSVNQNTACSVRQSVNESKCGPSHVNFMQMRFGIFRLAKRVVTLGSHVGRRVVTLG